jgi:hypothetical protein
VSYYPINLPALTVGVAVPRCKLFCNMKFKIVKKTATLLTFESVPEKKGEKSLPLFLGWGAGVTKTKSHLFFLHRAKPLGTEVEIEVEMSESGRLFATEHDELRRAELEFKKFQRDMRNIDLELSAGG